MAETTEMQAMQAKTPQCLDQQLLGQSVLKWHPSRLLSGWSEMSQALPSSEYLSVMHGLIKRIAQLQSTHEQPHGSIDDPEILLPLVLPEAQAVLQQSSHLFESGKAEPDKPEPGKADLNGSFPPQAACWKHPVQPIRNLAAWLLWRLAQDSHETMQLLEGIAAQISTDRQIWHSGIVRLVACLEVQTAQTPFSLDLVTLQANSPGLPSDCFVQIQASLLGQQTLTVKALLQRLASQLITTAPLQPFLAGFPVDLLVPQHAWQSGHLRVRLELAFIPTPSLNLDLAACEPTDSLPTVKFTDPIWLERHITTVVEDQLTQVLLQQKKEAVDPTRDQTTEQALGTASREDALMTIVRQSCAAIDELQRSLTLASRTFAQQVLPLDALALRVLWGINRTAYQVMQWLSGLQVRLLQPQQGWTTGTLRLAIHLVIRTPEQAWRFDVVQRCLTSALPAVAEDAIVQLGDEGFQLLPLSDLATEIWQQVSQTTPEMLLLCSETEVNVTVAASPGQLGVLQLQTAFEFTASGNFSEA